MFYKGRVSLNSSSCIIAIILNLDASASTSVASVSVVHCDKRGPNPEDNKHQQPEIQVNRTQTRQYLQERLRPHHEDGHGRHREHVQVHVPCAA